MKIICILLACAFIVLSDMPTVYAGSQESLRCYPITLQDVYSDTPPQFRDYPANHAMTGLPAAPVFDSPQAVRNQEAIIAAAAKGPDFAGHYTLAKLSCGVTCMRLAVIDAQTGKVRFPEALQNFNFVHVDDVPMHYTLGSNLLIVLGTIDKDATNEGIHYFMWTDNAMTLVESIPVHKQTCN